MNTDTPKATTAPSLFAYDRSDRRSLSEIAPETVCGCGRLVRYIVPGGNQEENSCNKYGRCLSWDELQERNKRLLRLAGESLEYYDNLISTTGFPESPSMRELRAELERQTRPQAKGETNDEHADSSVHADQGG